METASCDRCLTVIREGGSNQVNDGALAPFWASVHLCPECVDSYRSWLRDLVHSHPGRAHDLDRPVMILSTK
jgi:hypothetical protein